MLVDYYIACDIIIELIMLQAFKLFLSEKERLPEKNISYLDKI
jgi:hypothetical protein